MVLVCYTVCTVMLLVSLPAGIWEYIEVLRDRVSNLENRVTKAQSNVKLLDTILITWVQKPIFERRDGKKDTLLNLEDKGDRLVKVYVSYDWIRQ